MSSLRALCVVALLLTTMATPQAAGQVPSSDVHLQLIRQPLWHQPGKSLGIALRITNDRDEPLGGFLLRIEGHPRVSSRSALHETFDGNPGFSLSSFTIDHSDERIAAGEARIIKITEAVTELASLEAAADGGVYPVTISLLDAQGSTLFDDLTTSVIYYPTPPEVPLGIALTLPLNEIPARDPEGIYPYDPTSNTWPLEAAVAEAGWLTGWLVALDATTNPPAPEPEVDRRSGRKRRRPRPTPEPPRPLHVSLAPVPRFIEELQEMSNGFRRAEDDEVRQVRRDGAPAMAASRALDRVATVLQRESVQTLLVPYAFPDLPAVAASLPIEQGLNPQFVHGHDVLADALGIEVSTRWIFAPAGRLDAATLADLKTGTIEGFEHTLFAEDSLERPTDVPLLGCPSPSPSITCPAVVREEGSTRGLVTDTGIQDRFADLARIGADRLHLQNLFAETAMIREETPGVAGRVVQATVPSLWHPTPDVARFLLQGLMDAPWLLTLTPDEGLQTDVPPSARRLVRTLTGLEAEPPSALFTSISEAQDLIDSFKLVRPPEDLTRRLSRNLLLAQSRMWATNDFLRAQGERYVAETLSETQQELDKITIGGVEEIRLTSQQGEIPIEVFNDATYDVNVNVRIESPDLRINETHPHVLQAGRFQQITVDVNARTSGIFPVEISLETPDGSYEIDSRSITVRSTEFNQVAVIITIGALAFLVLFYVVRGLRRRDEAEGPA